MKQILHKELSYKLTGLFFKIHKDLGRFCREKQYSDALEQQLKISLYNYQREIEINTLKENSPKGNKVDFILENKIIIDLKAKPFVTKEDYQQMQRYLQSSGLELGIIINFRPVFLHPKRILNTKLFHLEHSD